MNARASSVQLMCVQIRYIIHDPLLPKTLQITNVSETALNLRKAGVMLYVSPFQTTCVESI